MIQPYTRTDLERGEQIVRELHGLKGYDAWAERIAKAIAAERGRAKSEGRRLARIKQIIESVDQRCLAADGPVTPTLQEMTQDELSRIYALACGKQETWRP